MRGTLGGSRLLSQPAHAPAVAAWQAFLHTDAPVLVEVGFDHGRRLSQTAARHPGWRVAGLEVRRERVEQARQRAEHGGLDNLFVWRIDARTVLANATPASSVDVVEVLFPNPWWNPVLRARRLMVDEAFLADVARVLTPRGFLHLATDVDAYAAHIDATVDGQTALARDPSAAGERPAIEALSRREWRCAQDGIPIHRWWLRRAADPSDR